MANLNPVAPLNDASFGSLTPHMRDPGLQASKSAAADQADVRLVIEEDQSSGAFIYKTMDRRTGQVIQQFPREEILRLKQESEYQAGAVIDARA
jgi:flagellar protein FlaG